MPTGKQKRIKKRLDRRQSKVDESRATFGSTDPHMGKFDRRLNRLKRTVNQAEKQGMDVNYDTRNASGEGTVKRTKNLDTLSKIYSGFKPGSEMTPEQKKGMSKYKSATQMGHSPAKMESNKQEKYNLLHDNPVANHGSWMSKHSKSAFQMGHSPAEMGHESPAKMHGGDHNNDKIKDMKKKTAALNELRRQKGDFGDIPANSSANPKSLSGDDSKEIANMKRKLKALNELRRQKGHFNKK